MFFKNEQEYKLWKDVVCIRASCQNESFDAAHRYATNIVQEARRCDLTYAKTKTNNTAILIDEMKGKLLSTDAISVDNADFILKLVSTGMNKLDAIKQLRDRCSVSLKEAKHLIDFVIDINKTKEKYNV